MLASPYVADHKDDVEFWCSSLAEIEEIVDLWFAAQKKVRILIPSLDSTDFPISFLTYFLCDLQWLYFLKIFENPEMYRKLGNLSSNFEEIHFKFIVSFLS